MHLKSQWLTRAGSIPVARVLREYMYVVFSKQLFKLTLSLLPIVNVSEWLDPKRFSKKMPKLMYT